MSGARVWMPCPGSGQPALDWQRAPKLHWRWIGLCAVCARWFRLMIGRTNDQYVRAGLVFRHKGLA